jgi:hypothetical protein
MKTLIVTASFLILGLTAWSQQSVEDWQKKAVADFPDLAVKGSAMNIQYLQRVQSLRSSTPSFFNDSRWPYTIAEQVAKKSIIPGMESLVTPIQDIPKPPKPCERISEFLVKHLAAILSPLDDVISDTSTGYSARTRPKRTPIEMPQADLMLLNNSIAAEAATASQIDKPRYQAALTVCTVISQAMNERQKAQTALANSLRTNTTSLSQPAKGRSIYSNPRDHEQQVYASQIETQSRHNARWQERTGQLREHIQQLLSNASRLEQGTKTNQGAE